MSKLPRIGIAFCRGFFVVSRKDTDESDVEKPKHHTRHPIELFPFIIWFVIMKHYWAMKYKEPWETES
jgi:hypothetical protein